MSIVVPYRDERQYTLGKLIKVLELCSPKAHVYFDFCQLVPRSFHSYRGYYEDLQLDWRVENSWETLECKDFLILCKEQLNSVHTGWKGGDFRMTENTPIWVGEVGKATHVMLTEILHDSYLVMLGTSLDYEDEFVSEYEIFRGRDVK